MKRLNNFITFVFAFVLLLLPACLVGCNNSGFSTRAINMSRYFLNNVESSYLDGSVNRTATFKLGDFTADSAKQSTMKAHKTLTFSRNDSWLTGMYIEAVVFYINIDKNINDCQFAFTLTGLDGGVYDPVISGYKFEKTGIGINAKANVGVPVRINVGHSATANALDMIFSFEDDPHFGSYNWTIYGLAVYGETRL